MIELTRSLVRQFRAVVRQSLPPRSVRPVTPPTIALEASGDGLFLRAHLGDVAVEYHQVGACSSKSLTLPITAFDDFEARSQEKVALEAVGAEMVRASWHEAAVARERNYQTKHLRESAAFPVLPKHLSLLSAGFLKALDEARKSTARDAVRYSLNRIQLCGAKGEIVGTDGHQLLIQSGFELPWQEDVLVPAVPVFGSRELAQTGTLRIGKTDSHVCLRTGPWTFFLLIDRDGRYPRVEEVIPRPGRNGSTCRLDAQDAAFLSQTLSRLRDPKDENQRVTLDLNGRVIVRVRSEGQDCPNELVLERSTASGPAVHLTSNGRYLKRALELGLTEFQIGKPDGPVLAKREGMRFVWMPLSTEDAVPARPAAQRIQPPAPESKPKAIVVRREPLKVQLRGSARPPLRRIPVNVPRSAPGTAAQAPATTESRTTQGRPFFWNVLRTLFAPRGWLWHSTPAPFPIPSATTESETTSSQP